MKKTLLFLLFNLVVFTVISQNSRIVQDEEQVWTGYFNQTRLSDKWGIWLDVNLRTTEHFVKNPSKAIGRLGLMYYLNDDLKFTNAYAFINHFPEEGHANISQPEHRIWHQLQWHTKYGKIRTMQWVRLEERFRQKIKNDNELSEGYRFDERIRYNFLLNIPLNKKGIVPKSFSAILNDEVMVNLSKNNVYNIFDQNRFFIGRKQQLNKHLSFEIGYMLVYQQKPSGILYDENNTFRIFFYYSPDMRKK